MGEGATVKGEVMADDVVINGRIIGRVRGLKVRLTSTARVEGDIIHKTIAIESGAHFEGSVQRRDDPLNGQAVPPARPASPPPPRRPGPTRAKPPPARRNPPPPKPDPFDAGAFARQLEVPQRSRP